MRLIELHILQSFPVTCLNRDDVGAPKSAVFGGVPRARVSSQCWKRAIRQLASETASQANGGAFAGQRSHFMAAKLQEALEQKDVAPEKAKEAADMICTFLGKQDSKYKEGHKTSVALYLSPMETDAVATAAAAAIQATGKAEVKKGDLRKAIAAANPNDLADIAIFGRMVANDHTLMIEGAGMFSHALSTHQAANEVDFFSAVDELKPEESEGAGHIGTLEFNSACYYRYVGLNWDLLGDEKHLGHFSPKDREQVVNTFLRAAILAVPNARHNSMFGHNPPQYVLGLVREGQPLSLVNAFEQPIRSNDGYVQRSREALQSHYKELKKTYGFPVPTEVAMLEKSLDELVSTILKSEVLNHA